VPRGVLPEDLAENSVVRQSHQVETFYDGDKEVLSSALKALVCSATVVVSKRFRQL